MMKFALSVMFCFVCALSISVSAQNGPPEFKGFYFGKTTYEDWRAAVTEHGQVYGRNEQVAPYCGEDGSFAHSDKPELGILTCSWYRPGFALRSLAVGQAPTNHDTWTFVDGKLASFSATLYVGQLRNLLPSLNAKYGPPTNVMSEDLQNAFGAKFTNEVHFWSLDEMSITVSKLAGSIDTSIIVISNPNLAAEKERRINSASPDTSGL